MTLPTLRDLHRRGAIRLTGHAELYKRGDDGALTLMSTTRPCEVCGMPLNGLVIPKAEAREQGQALVHDSCIGELL